ncbi:hypothetical protein ALI144C_31360 [Actinosynnema sp. ALI-1.44]|uniref:hypothetical protein n=1 Tax=Actinosynnema sp. ALI-1.44 TaxID=1933779 RepID=UPI00097C1143|nr:hypothetical protein [Actinosynnema sp. ALI-1.44]ONI77904.1 hypothetical protein ALI144C_31360 [Actinosynnema sp. ALI-1.44]
MAAQRHGTAIDYDGRAFRSSAAETASGDDVPTGHYHQHEDLVWAEFSGGKVRTGRLVGRCTPEGVLHLVYGQVLDDGRIVAGECVSVPQVLQDGRIRLREQWHRVDGSTGVSWIEEVPSSARHGQASR